jgi:hypothetical protein
LLAWCGRGVVAAAAPVAIAATGSARPSLTSSDRRVVITMAYSEAFLTMLRMDGSFAG